MRGTSGHLIITAGIWRAYMTACLGLKGTVLMSSGHRDVLVDHFDDGHRQIDSHGKNVGKAQKGKQGKSVSFAPSARFPFQISFG